MKAESDIAGRVEQSLETIRPFLHMDGGDVKFLRFRENTPRVFLTGEPIIVFGASRLRAAQAAAIVGHCRPLTPCDGENTGEKSEKSG